MMEKNKLKRQRSGKQEVARECGAPLSFGRGAWVSRAVPRLSGDWAGHVDRWQEVALWQVVPQKLEAPTSATWSR